MIATPLMEIVKKNVGFHWSVEHENAFNTIKDRLYKAQVLTLPNFDKTFEIKYIASWIVLELFYCMIERQ